MGTGVHHIAGCFTAAIMLPGVLFGQIAASEPINTTICELAKAPERFNGDMVEFRAEFVSRSQWNGFVDESCSGKVPVGVYHVLDELKPQQGQYAFTTTGDQNTHPERLHWKAIELPRPVYLRQDDDYRLFQKYAETKFRWPGGMICRDCPLYRIIVTATGRFDYFETQSVAVRANPNAQAVIHSAGEANAPLIRLALESVSDVAATPIDPSVYPTGKRRNISQEEANDLVYAYLKSVGCTEHTCGLEPYHFDPA